MVYRKTKYVEERLADTRKKILKSARALVSEGGWGEAQISNVAASAGVSIGSVYRYFPSKADLFVEVLSSVSQREVDVLITIIQEQDSPITRLQIAVATFVKRAMRNRRLAYAMIAEPCDKEIDAARLVYRHAISKHVMEIIIQGQKTGDFRPDISADIAATLIVGGFMEGLIGPLSPLNKDFIFLNENEQQVIDELANQIADACCAAIVQNNKLSPITHEKGSKQNE